MPYWSSDGTTYLDENGVPIAPPADEAGWETVASTPSGIDATGTVIEPPATLDPYSTTSPLPSGSGMPEGAESYSTGSGGSYGWSGANQEMISSADEQYNADVTRARQMGGEQYNRIAGNVGSSYDSAADAVIDEGAAMVAPTTAEAEMAKIFGQAEWNRKLGQFAQDAAAEEQRMAQAAQATAAGARAKYEAQVAAYQAMEVDPGKLFTDAGAVGSGAMLFAVMGDAFLKAKKGIGGNVSALISQSIDRNIDAQLANIQKQGKVAEHFRELWDMVRAESATEAEARVRIRGFHLAALEKQMLADLAQYDAPLAMAKAAETRAEIMKEKAKVLADIDQMIWGRVNAAQDTAAQMYRTRAEAAMQSANRAWQSREAQKQRDHEKDMKKPAAGPDMDKLLTTAIYDPETREIIGFDSTGDEKMARETTKYLEGHKQAVDLLGKYQDWVAENPAIYDGMGGRLYMDAEEAHARSLYNMWVSAEVKRLSGLSATNVEREFIMESLPFESWLRNPEKAIAERLSTTRSDYETTMGSRVRTPESYGFSPDTFKGRKMTVGGRDAGLPSTKARQTVSDDIIKGAPVVKSSIDKALEAAKRPNTKPEDVQFWVDSAMTKAIETKDPKVIKKTMDTINELSTGSNEKDPLDALNAANKFSGIDESLARGREALKKYQ